MQMWKREIKEKVFGGYKIRKKRNSYYGEGAKDENKTHSFELWKDIKLDKAFEAEDINPFISSTQRASQLRLQREFRKRRKESLRKIQRNFRKAYGKTIPLFQLGKMVRKHSEAEARRIEIDEALTEIRADAELGSKYEGAVFIVKDGIEYAKLKDKTLKFNHELYNGDVIVKAVPANVTESELWELYGDVTEQEV